MTYRPSFRAGDPRTIANGRLGGKVSGALSKQRALDRIREVWPGMPDAAAAAILAYVEKRVASALTTRSRRERKTRGTT